MPEIDWDVFKPAIKKTQMCFVLTKNLATYLQIFKIICNFVTISNQISSIRKSNQR